MSDKASVSCYKPVKYMLRFCRSFEVKLWFPQFGGTGISIGVGLRGIIWGISDYLLIALQSPYIALQSIACCGFAAVLKYFLIIPILGERGAPRGSTMVPLGRELSLHTTLESGTFWSQFAMEILTSFWWRTPIAERCRTDDLLPSIPISCLPSCRMDPKVLRLNILINCSQPGGPWTTNIG